MTGLRKVLKLRTVVSSSAGLAMATSCYLAGLYVAVITVGELAWVSLLIAGILCLLSAMCFSELTALYPTAAGIKLYIQNAFNEKTAVAISMFYVIGGASIVGVESYLLSSVLLETMGVIIHPLVDRFFWQLIFILLVGYINYRGVVLTGRIQDFLTYLMLGFLICVGLYTFAVKGVDLSSAINNPKFTLENIFTATAVGIFLFIGFEWVAPLAEETEDYRMVGKGMMLAIGLLSITYSIFVVAMYTGLTPEQIESGTTIPHILFARNLFGPTGVAVFIFMSILASFTSFNSGVLNNSRFIYAMARANILPRIFSKLHPDHASPWMAISLIVCFAVILSMFTLLTGKYMFIVIMAAALECFIYVVVALCVLRLRKKLPDKERAYRVPFGKVIPVFTIVIFTLLMVGMFADSTKNNKGDVLFQNYWCAIAMVIFAGLTALYAWKVMPKLKAAAEEKSKKRKRRRPERNAPV
jgi:amino acid transporter